MPKLNKETIALLEDIESRIDCNVEDEFIQKFDDFVNHKFTGVLFDPLKSKTSTTNYVYQNLHINDCVLDYEQMLVSQLEGVSKSLEKGTDFLSVRCNYGTGILPSLFGANIFTMPRNTNTLPTTKPFNDDDKIHALLEAGIPDLENGFGKRVFDMGEFFLETFEKYPKIKKYVSIFHPDTQGPLDVCELLWGSEMLYALYDTPEFVHDFLNLLTDTYISFMEKWYKLYPEPRDWSTHWSRIAYKGKVMIRNDSAMNLSPDMYEEFAKPYDMKILDHFGGGCIHFCGRGDHYIDRLSSMKNLNAINLSQPHLNDMEQIYKHTVDKNIQIIGLSKKWLAENDIRNSDYKHNISI